MSNPGDFAYTVKQQADIVRIVGDYVKLKKTGAQNYSGLTQAFSFYFWIVRLEIFDIHFRRTFARYFR